MVLKSASRYSPSDVTPIPKGDANEVSDGVSTNRSNFIGKNLCSIPKAGYVVK